MRAPFHSSRGLRPAWLAGVGAATLVVAVLLGMGGWRYRAPGLTRSGAEPVAPSPEGKSTRYALLIGCTRYPKLPERLQLEGPANDVRLMADRLVNRFGFTPENLVVLAEGTSSGNREQDTRPTRANIEREFRDLARKAKQGDCVFILVAGHGSQQPEKVPPDPEAPEIDGLNEIFLPADVGAWNGRDGTVPNAIMDKEIRDWLKAIRAKGASVWTVWDCCHAGTITRGTARERLRMVSMGKDGLGVPREAIDAAVKRAAGRGTGTRGVSAPAPPLRLHFESPARSRSGEGRPTTEPALVALYACEASEGTVELDLPLETADQQKYGLLTYTFCEVLEQGASRSALTYREVVQRIQREYTRLGRQWPTPLIEGVGLDREVFGLAEWPGRSRIWLGKDSRGRWVVNAGTLHGLTAGSILAVYADVDALRADRPSGHVEVRAEGLQPLQARVLPCGFHQKPAVDTSRLPHDGICKLVYRDYGGMRLKLAVDESTEAGESLPGPERSRLADVVRRVADGEEAIVELVGKPAEADWLLRVDSLKSGKAYLVPSSGVTATGASDGPPSRFGPIPDADQQLTWLAQTGGRIARAQNLLRILARPTEGTEAGPPFKLVVEEVRWRGDRSTREGEILDWQGGAIHVVAGDIVSIKVRNEGPKATDLTFLYVDSGYGIKGLYPRQTTTDNRLEPGKTFAFRWGVSGDTVGLEHFMVLAVESREQNRDFTFLEQPTLAKARGVAPATPARNGLNSPLGQLFQDAVFGGKTRGTDVSAGEEHQVIMLNLRVCAGDR